MAPRMSIRLEQNRGNWLGFVGRCVCVVTGGAIGFSFACPDKDTAYEVFPVQSQQNYVHISKMHADKTEDELTIEKIKGLHRFFQQQPGYLYSRLLKLDDSSNNSSNSSSSESSSSKLPRFVTVSTWLTPQDYALAWSKAIVLGLPQQIPAGPPGGSPEGYLDGPPPAVLYKRVADDSEYSPTA